MRYIKIVSITGFLLCSLARADFFPLGAKDTLWFKTAGKDNFSSVFASLNRVKAWQSHFFK